MSPKDQERVHPLVSSLPIPFIVSILKSFASAAAAKEYIATHNLTELEELKPHLPLIFYSIQTTERGHVLQTLSRTLINCQDYLHLNPQAGYLPFPASDVTTPPPQSLANPEADQENWSILSSCLQIHMDILGSPLTPQQSTIFLRKLFHFWLLLLACVPEVEEIAADVGRLETLAGGHPLETYLELNARYTDEEKAEFYVRKYVKVSRYFLWLRRQGAADLEGLNVGGEAGDRISASIGIRGAEALGGLEKAREVLLTVARAHVEFTAGVLGKVGCGEV
ncbi:hypothetical protein C7212DRAFT_363979 [Tuber magnatum]|uniref:Uncharacterized protein n=1 Tax=Tuber magnatum TaxID=42249 RepID=A0A317SRS8_9PEZI|nr:hypothetical protein C7212DRAFT_363979 [Tuber magnatum]